MAWFAHGGWIRKGDATRHAAAGRRGLDELRHALADQAAEAARARGVVVDAVVLDCSLPPVSGADRATLAHPERISGSTA